MPGSWQKKSINGAVDVISPEIKIDHEKHRCYFSVSAGTFNDLLHQTCPLTIHNNNTQIEQISAEEQLAVALHFLTALIFTLFFCDQSGH